MPLVLDLSTATGQDVTYSFRCPNVVNIDAGGMEYRYPRMFSHQLSIRIRGLTLRSNPRGTACDYYTKEQFLGFFNAVKGMQIPFLVRCHADYTLQEFNPVDAALQAGVNGDTLTRSDFVPYIPGGFVANIPANGYRYWIPVKEYRVGTIAGKKTIHYLETVTSIRNASNVLIPAADYAAGNLNGVITNTAIPYSYIERLLPTSQTPKYIRGTFLYFVKFGAPEISIQEIASGLFQVNEFTLESIPLPELFTVSASDYPRAIGQQVVRWRFAHDKNPSAVFGAVSPNLGKQPQTYTYGWRSEYSESEEVGLTVHKARSIDNRIEVEDKGFNGRDMEIILFQFLAFKGKLLPFQYKYAGFGDLEDTVRLDTDEIDISIQRLDPSGACNGLWGINKLAFHSFNIPPSPTSAFPDRTINPYYPLPIVPTTQGFAQLFTPLTASSSNSLGVTFSSTPTFSVAGTAPAGLYNFNVPPAITSLVTGTIQTPPAAATRGIPNNTDSLSKFHWLGLCTMASKLLGTYNEADATQNASEAWWLYGAGSTSGRVFGVYFAEMTPYIILGNQRVAFNQVTMFPWSQVVVGITADSILGQATIDIWLLNSSTHSIDSNPNSAATKNVRLLNHQTQTVTLNSAAKSHLNISHSGVYHQRTYVPGFSTIRDHTLAGVSSVEYGVGASGRSQANLRQRAVLFINAFSEGLPATALTSYNTPILPDMVNGTSECRVWYHLPPLTSQDLPIADVVLQNKASLGTSYTPNYGGTIGQQAFVLKAREYEGASPPFDTLRVAPARVGSSTAANATIMRKGDIESNTPFIRYDLMVASATNQGSPVQLVTQNAARKFSSFYWIVIFSLQALTTLTTIDVNDKGADQRFATPLANMNTPYLGARVNPNDTLTTTAFGNFGGAINQDNFRTAGFRFVSPVFDPNTPNFTGTTNIGFRTRTSNGAAIPSSVGTSALAMIAYHMDGTQPHFMNVSMSMLRMNTSGLVFTESVSHSGYTFYISPNSLSARNSTSQASPYGIIEPISVLESGINAGAGDRSGLLYSEHGLNQGLTFAQVKTQARSCMEGYFTAIGETLPSTFVVN